VNLELNEALVDAMLKVGKMPSCERVLVIGAREAERLRPLKKKLLYAVSSPVAAEALRADGHDVILLPTFTASRMDRLKAALVGALASGSLKTGQTVLCAMSREDGGPIDTVMQLTPAEGEEELSSLVGFALQSGLSPQLLEVLIHLALRIGREGYEGRPLGGLIVVGDSTAVMERSSPLTLNPFQGYSEVERNLHDPQVRDTVLAFAMLDGAFIVRDDGVVLAAGRHLRIGGSTPDVPLGLGARHAAAAGISIETKALAISISQSSGTVRVYRAGKVALELSPSGRRGDSIEVPGPRSRAFRGARRRGTRTSA
jgi:diadenylate cyclase